MLESSGRSDGVTPPSGQQRPVSTLRHDRPTGSASAPCPSIDPEELDPALLTWDAPRRLDTAELPAREAVLRFGFRGGRSERPCGGSWWAEEMDLCLTDPGRDVDLTVGASLKATTRVWSGQLAIEAISRIREPAGRDSEGLGSASTHTRAEEDPVSHQAGQSPASF